MRNTLCSKTCRVSIMKVHEDHLYRARIFRDSCVFDTFFVHHPCNPFKRCRLYPLGHTSDLGFFRTDLTKAEADMLLRLCHASRCIPLRIMLCSSISSLHILILLPWKGLQIPLTFSFRLFTGRPSSFLFFSPVLFLSISAFSLTPSFCRFFTHIDRCAPLM
jgi:hypothetical protein